MAKRRNGHPQLFIVFIHKSCYQIHWNKVSISCKDFPLVSGKHINTNRQPNKLTPENTLKLIDNKVFFIY